MSKRFEQTAAAALVFALAGGLAGCDGMLSAGVDGNASLSFAADRSPSNAPTSSAGNDTIRSGAHTIVVSRAELRVEEIELKGEQGLKSELKGGSTLVALPMNGSVVTPVTANVAAGSYDEFEMKVRTVRVLGTFDGSAFDETVTVNDDLELDLNPPVVAAQDGTANVTVKISVANWFQSSDGGLIDLRALTDILRLRIAANIRASFEAFEDHDRDGQDDRSGEGSSHSGSGR